MKRLLTCVATLIAVAVVCGLIARERSILRAAEERARRAEVDARHAINLAEATAREALERARQSSKPSAPVETLTFSSGPGFEAPPAVDPAAALETLRHEYVQQQAVKAMLMQAEDLQAALESTNHEIRELDAQTRLKDVSDTLTRIVEECSGTQAAPIAEQMLELYRNPHRDAEVAAPAEAAASAEAAVPPAPAQEEAVPAFESDRL